jgi:hypothetical protein
MKRVCVEALGSRVSSVGLGCASLGSRIGVSAIKEPSNARAAGFCCCRAFEVSAADPVFPGMWPVLFCNTAPNFSLYPEIVGDEGCTNMF